jgi:hypothetical protein
MDIESKQAAKLLGAIVESRHQLFLMADDLRTRPEVSNVSQDFECYRNQGYFEFGTGSAYIFDWYVDIELHNGNSLWWKIELFWDELKWNIESRIGVPGDNGPNTLKEFPSKEAKTIDDLINQLEKATSELVNSVNSIDLLA